MDIRTAPLAVIVIVTLFTAVSSCRVSSLGVPVPINGTIRAETITLSAGTSGEVRRVAKTTGDRVSRGELLVRLDAADSAGKLTRARKRLADATEQERNAGEELERTKGEVTYSRGRYLTFSYLLKKGAVASKEVERLKDEWEFAEEQNRKAAAYYERAQAELDEARDDLTRTETEYGSVFILAPADGFLTRLMTWEGGYLLKGEEALTIARAGGVYFTGVVRGDRPIALGADATVLPLAVPTGTITGYVTEIRNEGGAENPSRIVTIRLFPKTKKDVANIGKRAWAIPDGGW
jgi:multidrug resistance efflux pump